MEHVSKSPPYNASPETFAELFTNSNVICFVNSLARFSVELVE